MNSNDNERFRHESNRMDQLLTILIQTSPIPSHPSVALLEALFRSFQQHADGLLECKVVVVADGYETISTQGDDVHEQKENVKHGKVHSDTASRYREHLDRLRQTIEEGVPPFLSEANGSIELWELSERHGQARAIKAAFELGKVTTPLVMICQHDNFFIRDAPLRVVVEAMARNPGLGVGVTCMHFLSTSTLDYLNKVKKRYGINLSATRVDDLEQWPLVPLAFWYGRTHVAYAQYYRTVVLNRPLHRKDHLEELLGPEQLQDICIRGAEAHKEYGTYVLDTGKNEDILYHLSGRRAMAVNTDRGDEPCEQVDDCVAISARPRPSAKLPTEEAVEIGTREAPLLPSSSFTTARSCKAIVPGLALLPERARKSKDGRFRQKCFHCGIKGHSFKFCPNKEYGFTVSTETIDLS